MSPLSIVAASVGSTVAVLLICALLWSLWKRVRGLWRDLTGLLQSLTEGLRLASGELSLVRSELSTIRNITQPGISEEEQPQPPLGRASYMPPAFPQRDLSTFGPFPNIPAKREDTDYSLLTETEDDVMAAQEREERRAHGLEVNDYNESQPAVREDV